MSRVLITGASYGLGLAVAERFAKEGYDLLLVARSEELLLRQGADLKSRYGVDVRVLVCDLAKDGGPLAVLNFCHEQRLVVDILINNAAVGCYGLFADGDLREFESLMALNNRALVELCYYFVAQMKKQGFGQIVNVASIGAFVPGPFLAVYYASKSFVFSFSLALREELKDSNIVVSVLCPGPMRTAFMQKAGAVNGGFFERFVAMSAERVAASLYNICVSKKRYQVVGFLNKLAVWGMRFIPLSWSVGMAGLIQKKAKHKEG